MARRGHGEGPAGAGIRFTVPGGTPGKALLLLLRRHHPYYVASALATELGCDVLQSAGKYLDVLPAGVNKGSTLFQLLELIAYPGTEVLVSRRYDE